MKESLPIWRERLRVGWWRGLAIALALCLATIAAARPRPRTQPEPGELPRLSEEKNGTLQTRDGLRLRLVADLGNVRILTQSSGQVRYKVRVEVDARVPGAQEMLRRFSLNVTNNAAGVQLAGQVPAQDFRGHLVVNYEVSVPRHYNLDVLTQAGNIEAQDIDGRVSLVTYGGNITAGRVGWPGGTASAVTAGDTPLARLETQGGHVTVQDVSGVLRAITAGGHITAGNVQGKAVLRSGGGHIRAGAIQGRAQLETGGGNISVRRVGGNVNATTGGGQIDFEEAVGSIRARTGGGGIRILRVAGPVQLESGGGSIVLTRVEGPVRASTGSGAITAWFSQETPGEASAAGKPPKFFRLVGASQLESGQGDIVVYLPRELAVTIDATIETPAEHHIEADPALALRTSYEDSRSGGRTLRGTCSLNGGGEVLKLKTSGGNIQLKLSDTDPQIRVIRKRVEDQVKRQLEQQQLLVERQQAMRERQLDWRAQRLDQQQSKEEGREASTFEEWKNKFEILWLGGLRVDPALQQQKLVHSVKPEYPEVARRSGVEGTVHLQATIGPDGAVREVKVLSGHPLLGQAATAAVRQWRYRPTVLDGKPVSVIINLTVEFKLR